MLLVTEKCERGEIGYRNYNKRAAVDDQGGKKGATERSLERLGGKDLPPKWARRGEEERPMEMSKEASQGMYGTSHRVTVTVSCVFMGVWRMVEIRTGC